MFFRDRDYFSTLVRTALPIAIQSAISSSINLVSIVMIGSMGETAVASVGLANQIFFLLMFLLFGMSSGAAVFTAQLWGKKDVLNIRRVVGLGLAVSLGGALIFTLIAAFIPEFALGLYTTDAAVIENGSHYLRIICFSYFATAITYTYASVLRSTGDVRVPAAVSAGALALDALLNYTLIFGKFGFPQMGIAGAATATAIARVVECVALLIVTYTRRLPAAASLKEMLGSSPEMRRKFFNTALPVVFNETLWSLGITTYNGIYAHISTMSIAAINISSSIENLAFVIFISISNATSIMIGNRIGAGDEPRAFQIARKSLILQASGAILMGVVIYLTKDLFLNLYNVAEEVRLYAHNILTVVSFVLWIRISNMTLVVGILRSGGDTRFSLALDIGPLWLIGVPMALVGANVLGWPVHQVYLLVMLEEVAKLLIGIWRFLSKKWIHNLVHNMPAEIEPA